MNKTLVARLVIGALATIAAGGAMAGQIQASSTSIAREVITTNAQTVVAPTTAYRFAGDVDPTVQTQVFQVQLTLATAGSPSPDTAASPALWDTSVIPTDDSFILSDGITGLPTANPYTIVAKGFSTDKKTLWVTISATGGNPIIKQPIVTFNGSGATTPAKLINLKDVVGDLAADYANGANGLNQNCAAVKTMPVGVKHFVALSNPSAIATGSPGNGVADEHIRAGATNEAVSIVFPTNIGVAVTATTSRATLAPGGNLTFADLGGAGDSWVDADTARLGSFALSQLGSGYDANLVNPYALNTVALNGVRGIATAATVVGEVEVKQINVNVTATQGFVVGGSLFLSTAASNCAAHVNPAARTAITAANAAGPVTLTLDAAGLNAAALTATGTGAIQVCYDVPGTTTIPSSAFTAIATVVKADAGANVNEQNNACGGPLYSLGGGLKIDVRNYASHKENSGYQSVIRVINNSDAREADVWGQIIHQDGKLGGWGLLTTLKPRASVNMTAAQIDAKLTSAATAAVGPLEPTGQNATATTSDTAPRLRITSTTGSSLRVQNYLYNSATGQILEASGSQAVDYEGNNILRAPTSDGQYISQDANSGLNLQ